MSTELITQLGSILGPVVLALVGFVIGHKHLLIKAPAVTPTTPAVPATPVPVDPNNLPIGQGGLLQMLGKVSSALPHVDPTKPIAPIGQGGILQLTTLLLQGILSSPATPTQKAAAISAVVSATEPINAASAAPVVAPSHVA